jgi:hypothetical protein
VDLAGSLLSACDGSIELGKNPIPIGGTGGPSSGVGGGGGTSAAGGGSGGGGSVVVELPAFSPAPIQMRVLLGAEYRHTIRDVFGTAAAAAVTPPPDAAINGLTAIGASQLSVSTTTKAIYEKNAYLAVQAALANAAQRAKLIPCAPTKANDTACFTQVLDLNGKRLFRRPVTAAERTTWLKVADDAATAYGTFLGGAEFLLAGLLQSPNFLYRAEQGVANPERPGEVKLTGYEMATRLSYFIGGSTPSDELLTAAAAGELDTAEGLKANARKALTAPGASLASTDFFGEFLSQEGLGSLAKDPISYPNYRPAMAGSMRDETRLFLEDVLFVKNLDARTLFDADFTYVDANLAPLYNLAPPASGFVRMQLPAGQPRSGLLTQTAFLALMAHPSSTSPTHRGKFVRERMLCETVAAPPDNVSTTIPTGDPNVPRTLRQKLAEHMTNAGCRGCHLSMDPIGFGFENFDSIGTYRTLDQGLPIDASGTLDGKAFTDARGLGQALKADPRVMKCLTRTLFRHAAGHVDLPSEGRPIAALHESFSQSGFKYQDLLVELVASDAFRYARPAAGVTP